jgi:2-polyprenyl-3-methyl-5-hydroxy-6-metoxy-1,4-benzoquinol methylase
MSVSVSSFNPSYTGSRPDILEFVKYSAKKVLDVGCSTGALGADIKEKTGAKVYGIELSREMGGVASTRIDKVFIGDASELIIKNLIDLDLRFDTVIFSDILEHLIDPWQVVSKINNYLEPDGIIIASIPNIRFYNSIFNLVVKGYWPYRNRGIHDKSHLRFFTLKNINDLFFKSGFKIKKINTNYRIIEKPHFLNRFAKFISIPGIKPFLAYQYIVCAERIPEIKE